MKKYIFYISFLSILFCSGCYDEEIIASKPGEAIDPVTNLEYSISDANVHLTWDMPSTYPEGVIQPVFVQIKVSEDGRHIATEVLENAPESYTFTSYDPSKEYRFTVKVMANIDTSEPHESDLRYSLGQTVAL